MRLGLFLGLGSGGGSGGGAAGPLPNPIIGNQAVTFGALTLTGAGATDLVTTGGAVSSWAINSGDASDHWEEFVQGGQPWLRPTAAGDAANLSGGPYTLGVTVQPGGDTATITITIEANVYSVISDPEIDTVFDLGMPTVSGKTVKGRVGDYTWTNATWNVRAFTSETTFTSHDNNNRARLLTGAKELRDPTNLRFYQVNFHADFVVGVHDGGSAALIIKNDIDGLVFEDCILSGNLLELFDELDPIPDITELGWRGLLGNDGTTTNAAGGMTVKGCTFHGSWGALRLIGGTGGLIVRNNIIYDYGLDGIFVGGDADDTVIAWNDISQMLVSAGDVGHRDAIQFVPGEGQGFTVSNAKIFGNRIDAKRQDARVIDVGLQGLFLEDISSESVNGNYEDVWLAGNLIRAESNVHAISLYNPVDCYVVNNTGVYDPVMGGTEPAIATRQQWSGTGSGSIVADNVSHGFLAFGGSLVNNVTIVDADYDDVFDGPDFSDNGTLDELEATLSAKAGGALATAVPKVGAAGTYVNYTDRKLDPPRINTVNAFTVPDETDAEVSTLITSAWVQITDIDMVDHDGATNTASVAGALIWRLTAGAEVQTASETGGPTIVEDWDDEEIIIAQGHFFRLRATSSAAFETALNFNVQVGSRTDTWTVTTEAEVEEFSPADLSPNLWIDPSDLSTLFQTIDGTTTAVSADNDVVGYAGDKSGNAFHLTATADDTTRPVYNTAAGLHWFTFDGTNDVLRRTASLGSYAAGACSVFVAVKASPGTADTLVAERRASQTAPIYTLVNSDTATASTAAGLIRNDANSTKLASNTDIQAGVFDGAEHVYGIIDNGSTVTPYLDGVAGSAVGYGARDGTMTLDRFALGALLGGTTSQFFPGDVYGLVIVNRVLDAGEIADLSAWLAAKAGI